MKTFFIWLIAVPASLFAQQASEVVEKSEVVGVLPANWVVHAVRGQTQQVHADGVKFLVPVYRLAPVGQAKPIYLQDSGIKEGLDRQVHSLKETAAWAEKLSALLKSASDPP